MTLIFKTVAAIFFAFASMGIARAENDILNDEFKLIHEYMWICTAHSQHDHDHHRLYHGQSQFDRHDAEHSAVAECEYYERHACELAGCRRTRY